MSDLYILAIDYSCIMGVVLTLRLYLHRDGKAPKFLEKPSIKQQSGKIVMSVLVEAKPEPKVTWHRGSSLVSSDNRIAIRVSKGSAADSYLLICEISVSTQTPTCSFVKPL